MPNTYATHDLVTVAWVKDVLNSEAVATTLPQNSDTWWETGFVQTSVTGSQSADYYALRSCILTAHCWAARENRNSQSPPWGQANQLAEGIANATWDESKAKNNNLSLGATGTPSVRILETKIIEDPKRVPGDEAHKGHYTVSVQIWWVQRP